VHLVVTINCPQAGFSIIFCDIVRQDPGRSEQLSTVAILGLQFSVHRVVVPLNFLRCHEKRKSANAANPRWSAWRNRLFDSLHQRNIQFYSYVPFTFKSRILSRGIWGESVLGSLCCVHRCMNGRHRE